MKKPIGYYWYILVQFFKSPVKFIRKRRDENMINKGNRKLNDILNERVELRASMQNWLRKKVQIGSIKNDHHATQLVSRKFKDQLAQKRVRAVARATGAVIFIKEK